MADSVVPNEINKYKYVQKYRVVNLSGFLGVYNLCFLAKLKSRMTLNREGSKG